MSDYWNSVEKLGSLITLANWGIALSLLFGFIFTAVVIKAGNRKDKLTSAEDLRKAEHIANIDAANLILRGQVATLEINATNANKDLAGLQKSASDAKAAQQRVEIDLAKQQEKTAIAEKGLEDLRQTVRPRRLTPEQEAALVKFLSGEPNGTVSINFAIGDGEANAFANQISDVLKLAGWPPASVMQVAYGGGEPIGFGIIVKNAMTAPPFATRIGQAFFSIGIPMAGVQNPELAEGTVLIVVGRKPVPHV
jgi:hypothetical protein